MIGGGSVNLLHLVLARILHCSQASFTSARCATASFNGGIHGQSSVLDSASSFLSPARELFALSIDEHPVAEELET